MSEELSVTLDPDTEVGQIHAMYVQAKAQADEAVERADLLKAALKSNLAAMDPEATRVTLRTRGVDQSLVLRAQTSTTVDTKKLKAEKPHIWAEFARESVSWRLEFERGGG